MKKRAIFSLILAIALFQIHPAAAAVKAGGSCSKVNTTTSLAGTKLTCVKSGGKLIWKASAKGAAECIGEVRLGSTQVSRPSEPIANFKFDAGTPCSYRYTVKDFEGNLIDTVEVGTFNKSPVSIDVKNLTCDSIQKVSLTAFSKSNASGASVTFPPIENAWCGWTGTGPNPTPSPKAEVTCEGALRLGSATSERVSPTEAKFRFDAQYPCSYQYSVKDETGKTVGTFGPFNVRKTYIAFTFGGLTCDSRGKISLLAYSKPNGTGSSIEFPASDIPWCS